MPDEMLEMMMQQLNDVKKENEVAIARNKPCPCGSGKKYKHCCEKKKGKQGVVRWNQ